MKKNIAVLGCGYWGKNLVRNFYELDALYAVCDTDKNLLEAARKKYSGIKAVRDIKEIWHDDNVRGVVIATPAETHYSLAWDALQAGKDVFIEKPIALKFADGLKLVTLADEKKLILMVGHILEYHPAIVKLHDIINKGELGKISYIYSNRLNLGKFRSEENILWSFAPHDISVILRLLGEMPADVHAHGGNYLNPSIADVTVTSLNFPSGTKAHIFVSWLHPYKEQKLVVIGDKKMVVFDDVSAEHKLSAYSHKIDWIERMPVPRKEQAEPIPLEEAEPLKLECRHFLECLDSRKKPRTDGENGLKVLQVLEASQKSLAEGGKTVRLESGEERPFFIHESSFLDDNVQVGEETKIWHFSHVLKNVKIGEKCNIGQNVVIGPNVTIGNNVKIQNNVSVYDGVVLEDDVFCGPSMVFTNVVNPRSHWIRKDEYRKTLVQKGASMGANSTIVCGITIGKYAFVGAGAVVNKDVPPYGLVYGVPARLKGWMCYCGVRLPLSDSPKSKENAECPNCGRKYHKDGLKVSFELE